eukprot:scaffold108139_cov12-Tisochrysis_lutea.AAC.1
MDVLVPGCSSSSGGGGGSIYTHAAPGGTAGLQLSAQQAPSTVEIQPAERLPGVGLRDAQTDEKGGAEISEDGGTESGIKRGSRGASAKGASAGVERGSR